MLAHLGVAIVMGAAAAAADPVLPPLPMEPAGTIAAAVSPDRLLADVTTLVGFGTRHSLSATDDPKRGIGAARIWLRDQFARAGDGTPGRVVAALQPFRPKPGQRVREPVEMMNVLAFLPGSQSPKPPEGDAAARAAWLLENLPAVADVIVLAHYDSRALDVMDVTSDAPGANDDGSGTVALLELARVLAGGPQLRHGVLLVATAGEEQGLLGAKYLADVMLARPAAAGPVLGGLSMDMVGDPTGAALSDGTVPKDAARVRVFSEGVPKALDAEGLAKLRANSSEADSPSRELARFISEVAAAHKLAVQPMLVFRPDRFLRGGDHTPLNEAGLGAVRFTHVHESYDRQHQNVVEPAPGSGGLALGDVARFVDKNYLANVTRLVGAGAVHLAQAPRPPVNVRIVTANLDQDTTLRWAPGSATDTVGYEVVWRETTSPAWQWSRSVGNVNEVRLEINKDNFFLGVRAVGPDGERSTVVFAVAAKE